MHIITEQWLHFLTMKQNGWPKKMVIGHSEIGILNFDLNYYWFAQEIANIPLPLFL